MNPQKKPLTAQKKRQVLSQLEAKLRNLIHQKNTHKK